MSERLDEKVVNRKALDTLLDRIDEAVDPAAAAKRQELWRRFRVCSIEITLLEPGGTRRVINGISRNLSSKGISIVCRGYLHVGSACAVTLPTIDNTCRRVEGTICRCEYVGGRVHEVGLQFRQPIDTAEFVSLTVPARVLIVEDDDSISRMTAFLLNKAEASTVTVDTGEQAVEAAVNTLFDVILMDMMLPGMSGFDATRAIREQGVITPIIAFTALKDPDVRQRCANAGCTGFLAKPVPRHELLQCVLAHLTAAPLLSSLSEGPDMKEIVSTFVDNLPSTLATIRNCHKNNDLNGLLDGARNLNTAADMYGFEPISLVAEELENLLGGRGGNAVTEAARGAIRTDGSLDADAMNRKIDEKVEALLFVAQRARASVPA